MIHTARQSPKFLRLVRKLRPLIGQSIVDADAIATAILERLWHATIVGAVRGDIGRFDNDCIAEMCGWLGDADYLISILVECGWLDLDDNHRLLVHDWEQHAPRHVKQNIHHKGGFIKPEFRGKSQPTIKKFAVSGDLPRETPQFGSTPNLTQPNLTQPNLTPSCSEGEEGDWGEVDSELQEAGMGQRVKVLERLKAGQSPPSKVLQVIACWKERRALFRNPTGALYERLMAEEPGMAADSGWVVEVKPKARGRPSRDPTTDFEMRRAALVKQLRAAGESEEAIEAKVAALEVERGGGET